jgi:hypothetical protein
MSERDRAALRDYVARERIGRDLPRDPSHEAISLMAPNGMPADWAPNRHRNCRASRDSWELLLGYAGSLRGIAPGTENESDGTPTVLVYNMFQRHGTEVRPVSSFRRSQERNTKQQNEQEFLQNAEQAIHAERMAAIVGTVKDYD